MPAGNDLSFVGNLLALPLTLQAMHQQWEQQRQSQAGQLPTAASAPQMSSPFAPQSRPLGPEPPNPTGALNTPVLGTALRGIGTVGQILQVIGAPPPAAPRPMTPADAMRVDKYTRQTVGQQRIADAIRRGASRQELAEIEAEGGYPVSGAKLASEAEPGTSSPFSAWVQIGLDEARKQSLTGAEAVNYARQFALAQTQDDRRALQRPEKPSFPSKEKLLAIAAGAATDPQMTKEQAQATLDKEREYTVGTAAAKTESAAKAKELALTNTTKTMVESAPKVIRFVDEIERNLGEISTGPAASRYQEFMSGRVGAPNPGFTRYRTNVDLLTTLLMRMHVGARGGQQMLSHFQDMLSAGTQSPENMRAALEAIRDYASDVAATHHGTAPAGETPAGSGVNTTPGGNTFRVIEP